MPRTPHISSLPLLPLTLAVTLLLLCLTSCSRVQSIREARTIVAEADSLRNAGQSLSPFTFHLSPSKSDSAAMAEAAATLEPFRLFYPTAYAHANYYYGRILRTQGNQPEAMLAFLRVAHSRTKDHAIKARSYSNMGTMCHLADDYVLAYDMYELCADQFLMCGDSTLYFYALNSMAYELAEQGNKPGAYSLLSIIESQCTNEAVLLKCMETKAEACIQIKDNDSALYYSTMLWTLGNHEPTGLLIRAQAYDNLGEKDSALLYANKLFESSSFYGDRFNALYIITHNDTTFNVEDVLSLTSDRTDIQMEYTEIRAILSQATQLLQQDLNRKPDFRWLFAIIGTLVVIFLILAIYIKHKRRKRQLLSQQIAAQERQQVLLMEQNQNLIQQKTKHNEKALAEIEIFCNAITIQNIKVELCWKDFDNMCVIVNRRMFGLVDKLNATIVLNEKEMRLCILVAIGNFSNNEMADLIFYDTHSLRSVKSKIAGRLGVSGKNLRSYLLQLAIGV